MRALVACEECGFVTRRSSAIGVGGKCPHCDRPLEPVSFPAARRMLLAKRARLQGPPPGPRPIAKRARDRAR